ncbi:hypothetical protein [Halalkalicoccus sp. NIPERK01]|uniref:hypothetical protein n=1 Tax=Halalkalicoccus sp. NIPERK01 TaxID=3053469 RepID=UPI00256E9C0A|nr:hypothetical protein [Halalkalicoccus sp. NIPERK01]MDL5362801.1 hypothetical protein [Halalkalicoccus sp. NIPERK01]
MTGGQKHAPLGRPVGFRFVYGRDAIPPTTDSGAVGRARRSFERAPDGEAVAYLDG